jgi:hypothetical protein
VTNFLPGDQRKRHLIFFRNAGSFAQIFHLQLIHERAINPHFSGDMSSVGRVTLYLGDIFDRWVQSGMQGTYSQFDADNRTVTFDGSQTLLLENIELNADERLPVILEFEGSGSSEISHEIYFRQLTQRNEVYGNVGFYIEPTVQARGEQFQNAVKLVQKSNHYIVFPNPASEKIFLKYIGTETNNIVEVRISDVQGRVINQSNLLTLNSSEMRAIDTKGLNPGVYFVSVITKVGTIETFKFLKL